MTSVEVEGAEGGVRVSVVSPPSPSTRRTRLDADDRREQIVSAARTLFSAQPYESVSTSDIARAAGTTRTNILYHFSTKRDLFLEIIEHFSRIPDVVEPATSAESVEDRVASVFHRWLDAVDRNRQTFLTMLHAASSPDPQVSGVLTESMRAWERRLLVVVGMDPSDASHRSMVQSFQAMVAAATAAWLHEELLTKDDVHRMLTSCLIALGESAQRPS